MSSSEQSSEPDELILLTQQHLTVEGDLDSLTPSSENNDIDQFSAQDFIKIFHDNFFLVELTVGL